MRKMKSSGNFKNFFNKAKFCVFVFACFVFPLSAPVPSEMPQKTVFMLLWNGPTVTDRGFLDFFKLKGYNLKVITRDLNQNKGSISAVVSEIRQTNPDLIYVYGTVPAVGLWCREGIKTIMGGGYRDRGRQWASDVKRVEWVE